MAYITRANANAIRRKIDLAKVGNIPTDDIYHQDLSILSENERRWLAAAKMLYEDLDLFIEYAYSENKVIDTKTMIREGNRPAFHVDRGCENLRADYKNFYIPPEIQARGDLEIAKFRAWFIENEDLLNSNAERFITRMELVFKLKNPPPLKSIEALNSGVVIENNSDLQTIEHRIDQLINRGNELRRDKQKSRIILQHGNRSFNKTNNPEDDNIINEWHSLKSEIKTNLLQYFMVKFNPNLSFEGFLLERLGFRECSACRRQVAHGKPPIEKLGLSADEIPF